MAYGAHHSTFLAPHPNLTRARDCECCLGWGTVVTHDGRHELCPTCQSGCAGEVTPRTGPATR